MRVHILRQCIAAISLAMFFFVLLPCQRALSQTAMPRPPERTNNIEVIKLNQDIEAITTRSRASVEFNTFSGQVRNILGSAQQVFESARLPTRLGGEPERNELKRQLEELIKRTEAARTSLNPEQHRVHILTTINAFVSIVVDDHAQPEFFVRSADPLSPSRPRGGGGFRRLFLYDRFSEAVSEVVSQVEAVQQSLGSEETPLVKLLRDIKDNFEKHAQEIEKIDAELDNFNKKLEMGKNFLSQGFVRLRGGGELLMRFMPKGNEDPPSPITVEYLRQSVGRDLDGQEFNVDSISIADVHRALRVALAVFEFDSRTISEVHALFTNQLSSRVQEQANFMKRDIQKFQSLLTEHQSQNDRALQDLRANITSQIGIIASTDAEKRLSFDLFSTMLFVFAGCLLLLFVIIRFFDETTRQIIFSSNAILLIFTVFTIISAITILSLSNRIDNKDLVTLLAGISGYVFGQLRSLPAASSAARSDGSSGAKS